MCVVAVWEPWLGDVSLIVRISPCCDDEEAGVEDEDDDDDDVVTEAE